MEIKRDNSSSSSELKCSLNPSPPNYVQVKHLQRPKDFPREVKSYVFKFEHLPSVLNRNFCTKLISNLTGSNETKRKGEICEYVEYLFWSYAVQYTHPNIMTPTCVVLTQKHIFIQHFDGYSQDFPGVPHTTTYYILPLCNIQRILISHNVVQLEESFVGPSGIFLLYQVESPQIKTFTDILKKCYQNNADQEVPKIIDISGQLYFSDLIENVESKEGLYSSEITFTAIVIYDTRWHTLAVSENYLYLVKTEDFFFNTDCFVNENPDPGCCNTDAVDKNNKHSILKYYPIMAGGNVSFKWCQNNSKQLRFPEILNNVRYELHPLSMEFNCQEKTECLVLQFLSAKTRDEYLEKFTSLRSLNVNRLSLATRQEPEGANEDNDVECKKPLVTSDDIVLTKDCLTINHSSSLTVSSPSSSSSLKTSVNVQDVRRPSFTMPCEEQLTYLTQCNMAYKLVKSRSSCLETIGKMNGYELIQFFHMNIAHVGFENEEMMYVVWADVVPYRNPDQEILSLVVLTSRAVYCISDTKVKLPPKSKHMWMTHCRHKSDSAIDDHLIQGKSEDSHCSGILHKGGFQHSQLPRAFITIPLSQLVQVNIGMFNQCLRFTGPSDDLVCTVVTRDCATTEIFLQVTFSVLSSNIVTSADTPSDSEMDFYSLVTKSRSATEGSEYIHPSKVRFCYPGEEIISDILYIISDISREQVLPNLKTPYLIWIYILGFQIPMEASISEAVDRATPRTIILTNRHICLVAEDLVSYPLPDFARGLPDKPRHRILEVRKIEYLKRILVDSEPLKGLTLVFSDEDDEIDVDASFEYYSPKEDLQGRVSPPEISVRLLFQKGKEEEKLLQMLKCQWAEIHSSAELPVHTTTWFKQDKYSTSQGSAGCHTLS